MGAGEEKSADSPTVLLLRGDARNLVDSVSPIVPKLPTVKRFWDINRPYNSLAAKNIRSWSSVMNGGVNKSCDWVQQSVFFSQK